MDGTSICPRCYLGQVDCTRCYGTGKVTCSSCSGKGYREEWQHVYEVGDQLVRVSCNNHQCNGGECRCLDCNNGKNLCDHCRGTGRI